MTRERVPLDWATTQNNLGIALWTLGRARERDGAAGGGGRGLPRGAGGMDPRARAARLGGDAEEPRQRAFEHSGSGRAGRRGWRRRSRPTARRWRNGRASACRSMGADAENLGTRSTLGERESGTARLEEAVAAYRAALEERDARARAARLGEDAGELSATRFGPLGERESGTDHGWRRRLLPIGRRAGGGSRAPRVPFDWALTQMNLRRTRLGVLGGRETGTTRLEEAARCLSGGAGGTPPLITPREQYEDVRSVISQEH